MILDNPLKMVIFHSYVSVPEVSYDDLSDMINQPLGCNVVFNKTIAMEKRHSSTGAFLSHGGSRTEPSHHCSIGIFDVHIKNKHPVE